MSEPPKIERDKIIFDSLIMTCQFCPAQWEGETVGGKFVYIRYRWGFLSVEVAHTPDDWWHDKFEQYIGEHLGNDLDGGMSSTELRDQLILKGLCHE